MRKLYIIQTSISISGKKIWGKDISQSSQNVTPIQKSCKKQNLKK